MPRLLLFQGGVVRTYVYVDGFNLFYRTLKGSRHKWLDLKALVKRILKPQDEILRIKYFSALVLPDTRDPAKPINQQTYIRALESFIPEIEVHYGRFLETVKTLPLVNPTAEQTFAKVLKWEEKGSDVNLGVHLVYDACRNFYDCAVIVSNDGDLAEALRIAKEEFGKVTGVISPAYPLTYDLMEHASFYRYIRPKTLERSQLPDPIPGTSIHKPGSW